MSERVLNIGIASRETIKKRTIDIARGKQRPTVDEPRVWFSSLDSLAKVLSEKNMLLLEVIRQGPPRSMTELAEISGRALPNLSRTLHSMEQFGLIKIKEENHRKVPVVLFERVKFEVALEGVQGPRQVA